MRSVRQALGFLYSLRGGRAAESPSPQPLSAAWVAWFVPLGFAVGLLLATLVGMAWGPLTRRLMGDLLWLPVVPAMLVYWLGPGLARLLGWGRTWASIRLGGRLNDLAHDSYPGIESIGLMVVAIATAAVAQYVAVAMLPTLLSLPAQAMLGRRVMAPLGAALFPRTHYGALVLMGMWGNACVLLAACLGRPAGHADPAVRQLLAMPTAGKLLCALPVPVALSILFLVGWVRRYGEAWAVTVSRAVFCSLPLMVMQFGVTMLFAWLLARRVQGHCRATLLSAGLIGEIVFLLLFHAIIKAGGVL